VRRRSQVDISRRYSLVHEPYHDLLNVYMTYSNRYDCSWALSTPRNSMSEIRQP
jgi:hypothetical protein